jgi:hypothetical protein
VPSKLSAAPYRPCVVHVGPTIVPGLSPPAASATVGPAFSPNAHAATSPTAAAVVVVVDDVDVVVDVVGGGGAVLVVLVLVVVVGRAVLVLVLDVLVLELLVVDVLELDVLELDVVVVVGPAPGGISLRHSPSPGTPLYNVAVLPPVALASTVPAPSSRRRYRTRPGVFPGSAWLRAAAISAAERATLHTRMSSSHPVNDGNSLSPSKPCFSEAKTRKGSLSGFCVARPLG